MADQAIRFLSASNFKYLVMTIEKTLPGYWYSVSQKKDNIHVSLGASQYCLLDADRLWSLSSDGDGGRIINIDTTNMLDDFDAVPYLEPVFVEIRRIRETLTQTHIKPMPPFLEPHRCQSKDDLHKLKKSYGEFLRNLGQFTQRGILIEELYLGSCQLSVDCSIRGRLAAGTAFDECNDYLDGNIAEALTDTIAGVLKLSPTLA